MVITVRILQVADNQEKIHLKFQDKYLIFAKENYL